MLMGFAAVARPRRAARVQQRPNVIDLAYPTRPRSCHGGHQLPCHSSGSRRNDSPVADHHILADAAEVAAAAARAAVRALERALDDFGTASWVLAGGSSPAAAYRTI